MRHLQGCRGVAGNERKRRERSRRPVVFPPASSPITCFVDPSMGQLVGLEQAGLSACSPKGDVTVVPASANHISQIKLAYTEDGAFLGRLVFDLKADATAKPVSYTCGSTGGKAVDLLLSKGDFVVTKLGAGCAPLPSVAAASAWKRGGRRRSLSAAEPGTGLSARGITVAAAALASPRLVDHEQHTPVPLHGGRK